MAPKLTFAASVWKKLRVWLIFEVGLPLAVFFVLGIINEINGVPNPFLAVFGKGDICLFSALMLLVALVETLEAGPTAPLAGSRAGFVYTMCCFVVMATLLYGANFATNVEADHALPALSELSAILSDEATFTQTLKPMSGGQAANGLISDADHLRIVLAKSHVAEHERECKQDEQRNLHRMTWWTVTGILCAAGAIVFSFTSKAYLLTLSYTKGM